MILGRAVSAHGRGFLGFGPVTMGMGSRAHTPSAAPLACAIRIPAQDYSVRLFPPERTVGDTGYFACLKQFQYLDMCFFMSLTR
jgi:hypothetical protein